MVSALNSISSGPGLSAGRGHGVVFLGICQVTLLSQCLDSPPRSKWVLANCKGNQIKCWGVTCDGLVSHPGVLSDTSGHFMLYMETGVKGRPDKPPWPGPSCSKAD